MSAARPGSVTPLLALDGHDAGADQRHASPAATSMACWPTIASGGTGWRRSARQASGFDYEADVDATLDLLADHIEKHIDCDRLLALAKER